MSTVHRAPRPRLAPPVPVRTALPQLRLDVRSAEPCVAQAAALLGCTCLALAGPRAPPPFDAST